MNQVTKIKYMNDYVYHIQFDDGTNGDIDFSEYICQGTVFEALRNSDLFRNAKIEGGTIAWANGADIAPETLYEKINRQRSTPKDCEERRSLPLSLGFRP